MKRRQFFKSAAAAIVGLWAMPVKAETQPYTKRLVALAKTVMRRNASGSLRDVVPTMLLPGEFTISRSFLAKYPLGLLKKVNS
jgi:hypothetical protein